jgi:hypothetical protein
MRPLDMRPTPNALDHETSRASFSWQVAGARLERLASGRGLNVAHDGKSRRWRGAQLAVRWIGSR